MARIKIKHPRPRLKTTKADLLSILGQRNIYVVKVFDTDDGYGILTKDDYDADQVFQKNTLKDLHNFNFTPIVPPEIKTKKTVILFNVDEFVYENDAESIKEEIENKNSWATGEVAEVYRFPNSRTLKVTFTQTQTAIKATNSGLVLFNVSITPAQVKQEEYIPIMTCTRCYQVEDHTTNNCPKDANFKICSECGEEGHIWKECRSKEKRCINCGEAHRTLAMKCKKRKEAVMNKRQENARKTTSEATSYSTATKSNHTNIELGLEQGTVPKMMNCILNAHMINLAEPGTYNTTLNNLLKMNNLPPIKMPDNPPSAKILSVLTKDTQSNSSENLISETVNPHSKKKAKKRRKRSRSNTRNTSSDSEIEMETTNAQPTVTKSTKGTELGLKIITKESNGWPKENFNKDKLIDGLQRRMYKWTYTNTNHEEGEVYSMICNMDIDLKNCWFVVKDDMFNTIIPGLQIDTNRDPRLRSNNN